MKHALCRPPANAINVRRLGLNRQWNQDNGDPGLAFVGELGTNVYAWVANCSCKSYATCPLADALEGAATVYSSVTVDRRVSVPQARTRK